MTLHVQTLDRKIWRKDLLLSYLTKCWHDDCDAIIDFFPEGSCAEYLGLYRLLDEFCENHGYDKSRIMIKTANMVENHAQYQIEKNARSWYEINQIQRWLSRNTIDTSTDIKYHFANFTSRSNWARLWIATVLDSDYPDKTVQTYHYDPRRENYNYNGYIGLDDLVRYHCDRLPAAARFISKCPRHIDLDFLKSSDYSQSIFQHPNSYYPIQFPANLNLLNFYKNIFVDIVVEANVSGNCFLCTEKTWRPVLAKRPFIIMSNFDFLKNFQKLGFKTFDRWWPEDYDDWAEGKRIQKIQNILKEISSWSLHRLETVLAEMKPILDHNFITFNSLTTDEIRQVFR